MQNLFNVERCKHCQETIDTHCTFMQRYWGIAASEKSESDLLYCTLSSLCTSDFTYVQMTPLELAVWIEGKLETSRCQT